MHPGIWMGRLLVSVGARRDCYGPIRDPQTLKRSEDADSRVCGPIVPLWTSRCTQSTALCLSADSRIPPLGTVDHYLIGVPSEPWISPSILNIV